MAKYWYCYGSDFVAKNKENLYRFEKMGVDVNYMMEHIGLITIGGLLYAYTDKAHEDGVFLVSVDSAKATEIIENGKHISIAYVKQYAPISDNDNVNHPTHYTSHPSGVECIQITEHYNFCVGNAIKYLWRNGLKGEAGKTDKAKQIEDLEKAIWYINREIENLKQ